MMLLDIDNLSAINKAHGYGVGDRILERMGILLRTFFRQHDWVARYAERRWNAPRSAGATVVEQVELLPRLISIDEATRLLNTDIQGIEKLVTEGRLDPVNAGRHVRLERKAVEALASARE